MLRSKDVCPYITHGNGSAAVPCSCQPVYNAPFCAGIELMLLILKQKRVARAGALKALDFATTRSPANCERFVDQFGLKTIFATFMGKGKVGDSLADLLGWCMSR